MDMLWRQAPAQKAAQERHDMGLPLQDNEFGEAWRLATTNRVDLNVLVDYAWPRFLQRCGDFISAVGDDQAICDLLAALKPGSVTAPGGLYASALPDPPAAEVSCALQMIAKQCTCCAAI